MHAGEHTVRHDSPLDNWAELGRAVGEPQSLKPTPDGVDQAESRGLERELRLDLVVVHIVSNVLEDLVGLGPEGRFAVAGGHCAQRGW